MKPLVRTLAVAGLFAAGAALLPGSAAARGAGGSVAAGWHGGGWHGGGWHGGGWHGGGWHGGGWHGGGRWGHRGWGPGVFWGGVGLGLGLGAIGYYGVYGPGYYYAPAWDPYYYDAPVVVAPVYGAVEPAPAARSGQPVPQTSRAVEPIFYPKNGQSSEATENDRRECNRWATTQRGAMSDASIFQRATIACMEGRGYTAK